MMAAAAAAEASARSCGSPAKTRIVWGSRARVIAGVTASCASASLAGNCAKSCAPRASTRIVWGSRARVIAGVTGKPAASYGQSSGSAFSYAARCTDPSAMRPIGYVLLLVIAVALALSATRVGAQR